MRRSSLSGAVCIDAEMRVPGVMQDWRDVPRTLQLLAVKAGRGRGVSPAERTGKSAVTYRPGGIRADPRPRRDDRGIRAKRWVPSSPPLTSLSRSSDQIPSFPRRRAARNSTLSSLRDPLKGVPTPHLPSGAETLGSLRREVDRSCDHGLANDAGNDVRLRPQEEVRGAFDLGDT